MNVFEDLIVELKQENLLEQTVIDDQPQLWGLDADLGTVAPAISQGEFYPMISDLEAEIEAADPGEVVGETGQPVAKANDDLNRARIKHDVAYLQMVEHVLTAVESETARPVPSLTDELELNRALNSYLKLVSDPSLGDLSRAERELADQTRIRLDKLAERDAEIDASVIREYCETCQPALSAQALFAMARFYRVVPYSENARAKFDFVITRLFSKPAGSNQRLPLFERDETIGHLKSRFSAWTGIPASSSTDNDPDADLSVMSFGDFKAEAQRAESLEDLIGSDFFARFCLFKESINEIFFAPQVSAAAIDANLAIGNRFIELVDKERSGLDPWGIVNKFGTSHDAVIAAAIGRSITVADVVSDEVSAAPVNRPEIPADEVRPDQPKAVEAKKQKKNTSARFKFSLFGVNKWLLATAVVIISISVGLYIWSEYFIDEPIRSSAVQVLDLERTTIKEHLASARVSGETLYAVAKPSWDGLGEQKQREFLQRVLEVGKNHSYNQAHLSNGEGKTIAFISAEQIELYNH